MTPSIWKYLAPLTALLQNSLPKQSSLSPLVSALTMSNIYNNNNNNAPSKSCHVRVASYNVLSSHLASPSHFTTLNPNHLSANNRLPVILQKLDQEMQQKAILCLQEVSYSWAGALHTRCCNSGYHFVTGLYGNRKSGYMGVGIAFPQDKYKLMDVDIARYVRQALLLLYVQLWLCV
jgi:mRNA deadenylase 3'-5' endonuclease subunit Ccr4